MKYIGNGFIPGVPARDLSEEEVKEFGKRWLKRSGLYEDFPVEEKEEEESD